MPRLGIYTVDSLLPYGCSVITRTHALPHICRLLPQLVLRTDFPQLFAPHVD